MVSKRKHQEMPVTRELGTCPECEGTFPYRPNKRFCSERCRKANARKEERRKKPANAANSPEVKRQQKMDYDLAIRLGEALYDLPPDRRLGFIEEKIQTARRCDHPRLRRILTNPAFIRPDPDKKRLFPRRAPGGYCTFPQAANRYCLTSPWQAGVQEVVRGDVPEPATGIVLEVFNLAA